MKIYALLCKECYARILLQFLILGVSKSAIFFAQYKFSVVVTSRKTYCFDGGWCRLGRLEFFSSTSCIQFSEDGCNFEDL